jgi:hypothetical protein
MVNHMDFQVSDLNELLLTPRFLQYSGVPDLTAGQLAVNDVCCPPS